MDVRPPVVVLTGIEGYEVEPSESATDTGEVRPVASVATNEDPSPREGLNKSTDDAARR